MNLPVVLGLEIGIDPDEFLKKLFPSPWDALATFLAFVVLLIVVFFVAYKPVKKIIQKRGEYVEGKIKNAEDKELEANNLLATTKEEVKAKKAEAISIVENAKEEANKEKAAILAKAHEEKEAEVKKAKEEIAQEIEASKDEIHREIVSVAIDASSKVLEREITSKDNEKLVDNFINDLKEDK